VARGGGKLGAGMPGVYARTRPLVGETEVFRQLQRCREFTVVKAGQRAYARRVRRIPDWGILWFFVPRARVVVRADGRGSVGPDGGTWFLVVMAIGGLVVELTTDRGNMPRDYPPWFIYGYAGSYLALLILELVRTRRALLRALAAPVG